MVKTCQRNEIGSARRFTKYTLQSFALAGSMMLASNVAAQQPAQAQQQPGAQGAAPAQQPFPPLSPEQQAKLDQVLLSWQTQSQGTKTLECKFDRWHFDLLAAPAGVHANKAEGEIKYAKPDKGLFKVDSLMFYKGMQDGKPQYGPIENKFGEYWVCSGTELFEYDREEETCNVLTLPPSMQGKQIFNSPLPFVFNLDANEIKNRYWIMLDKAPAPDVVMLIAWPKQQEDRAQYKMVQIALNSSYEPIMLRMFAPNYHPKHAPQWDQYEFSSVKRNAIGAGISQFFNNFIPKKPPASWKVTRQQFSPPQIAQGQPGGQAAPQR